MELMELTFASNSPAWKYVDADVTPTPNSFAAAFGGVGGGVGPMFGRKGSLALSEVSVASGASSSSLGHGLGGGVGVGLTESTYLRMYN